MKEHEDKIKLRAYAIERAKESDYKVVLNCRRYHNQYQCAIIFGGETSYNIMKYYINKEAYKIIANKRGYSDDVIYCES